MATSQSIGERLHLLRLDLGWSAAECAYRLTLESNELIVPDKWETWERAADHDDAIQHFSRYVSAVGRMFGIDPESLLNGPWDNPPKADVVALSEHPNNPKK